MKKFMVFFVCWTLSTSFANAQEKQNIVNHQYLVPMDNGQLIVETPDSGFDNFDIQLISEKEIELPFQSKNPRQEYFNIRASYGDGTKVDELSLVKLYLTLQESPLQIVYLDTQSQRWLNVPFAYQENTAIFQLDNLGFICITYGDEVISNNHQKTRQGKNQDYIESSVHSWKIKLLACVLIIGLLYIIAQRTKLRITWNLPKY